MDMGGLRIDEKCTTGKEGTSKKKIESDRRQSR